jgi:hypothetical protein
MFNSLINSSSTQITLPEILLLIFVSLFLGFMIALVHKYRNSYSKNFLFTIALLPTLVSSVIMVVNGNLGAGITVAGAFSLVRFRSAPGNAREITTIFFAMAVGLALGMGYIAYAGIFTLIVSIAMIVYTTYKFGDALENVRQIRITVPEYTNYMQEFNEVMQEFAQHYRLDRIKTTNLGSLCEVSFTVHEKNPYCEKEFLDALRLINGNLPIIIQPAGSGKEEL